MNQPIFFNHFSRALRSYMHRYHLTRTDLREACPVSRAAFNSFYSGREAIGIKTLEEWMTALNVPEEERYLLRIAAAKDAGWRI